KSHMRPDLAKYLNLGMVKRARYLLTARNVRRGCSNTHVARDPSNEAAVAWTATGKGYHHGLQELGPSQHLEEVPNEGVFRGALIFVIGSKGPTFSRQLRETSSRVAAGPPERARRSVP